MATHFSGDPGTYINPQDREEWEKRDPIDLCRGKLMEREILSADGDRQLRERVQAEVDEAVTAAFAGTDPGVEDLFKDVYEGEGVI
jgi:pyruvate dehydrogenase E1 component alpha subunit